MDKKYTQAVHLLTCNINIITDGQVFFPSYRVDKIGLGDITCMEGRRENIVGLCLRSQSGHNDINKITL